MLGRGQKEIKITFDSISVFKVIGVGIVAFLGLLFLSKIITPLILIFISIFLAIALNPAVSWISRRLKSKNRVTATGAAYVLVIGFLMGFFAYVVPPVANQTIDFIQTIPQTISDSKNENTAVGNFVISNGLNDDLDRISSDLSTRFSDLGEPVVATAGKILTPIA